MTKLTTVPLLQDPPFQTTVTADRLPARTPLNADDPDWRQTRPVKPRAGNTSDEPASPDWSLVVVLRRKASELIASALADHQDQHGVAMPDVDRRLLGRSLVRQVVRDHAEDLSGGDLEGDVVHRLEQARIGEEHRVGEGVGDQPHSAARVWRV